MEEQDDSGLTPEQAEFLYVYSREYNIANACEITGIDRATVFEWQNICPVFRKKLEEFKEKLLDSHGRERGWGENNSDGRAALPSENRFPTPSPARVLPYRAQPV